MLRLNAYALTLGEEHTLLVTEDGVEILTARTADSPGGPVTMPGSEVGTGAGFSNATT